MTHRTPPRLAALTAALLLAAGCAASDGGSSPMPPPDGSAGVTQAGAQDFGLFRQILASGEIPGPNTLDALGFFAEHKLDYPAADCGEDVCLHGLVGVDIDPLSGDPRALVQLGMNSPVRAETLERPPLNLVLAVDTSESMRGAPIDYVNGGLRAMLDELHEGDLVSLVVYSDQATVVFEALGLEERVEMKSAISWLLAEGVTNLYDGLFTAYEVAAAHATPDRQNRVILLSDGVANRGITSSAKALSLATAYAHEGIGLTTIGVGVEFDVELMRALGAAGGGSFYFLENPAAVREVFTEEVRTFLYPLALDMQIDVSMGGGYDLREVLGTHGWRGGASGGTLSIPALFLARRTDSDAPISDGRRGGGGAILFEIVPRATPAEAEPPTLIATLTARWLDPRTGEERTQELRIDVPSSPAIVAESGSYSSETVEKGAVMLDLFLGFRKAAELADAHDPGGAQGVLEAVRETTARWLLRHDDPDIADDLRYLDLFIENLAHAPFQTPLTPPEVHYRVPMG